MGAFFVLGMGKILKGGRARWKGKEYYKSGPPFRSSIIEAVLGKSPRRGRVYPEKFRKDACGAWIVNLLMELSKSAWEVNHLVPVSKGGRIILQNLHPLHWKKQ